MNVSFTRNTFGHNIYTYLLCSNYLKYSSPTYYFFFLHFPLALNTDTLFSEFLVRVFYMQWVLRLCALIWIKR
jgi:hypothetical protein